MMFYVLQLFAENLHSSASVIPAVSSYISIWTLLRLFERLRSFKQLLQFFKQLLQFFVWLISLISSLFQNARHTQALATTPCQAPWSGWKIPQLDLQMQISRKFLHTFQVEKILQRLEGQRAKGRNLQVTAQVRGEESLVLEEIQEQLWLQLALFSKVLVVMLEHNFCFDIN